MTFPAARIGDSTVHGGVITVGTPTTLIGNMPAARIGDMHTCPLVTVAVPHVGGPIILGAFNVLTGGPPQSRVLDMCTCVGPPDVILMGHFTTLVGMAGAFGGGLGGFLGLAMGGMLAGLENLLGDQPRAVLDPSQDAGYYTQYSDGVRIEGSPEFQARVIQDLDTIAGTDAGDNVLGRIADSGCTTIIRETDNGNSIDEYDPASARMRNADGSNGDGTDSVIEYNPNRTDIGDGSEDWMTRPADVGLFHELRHAADAGEGAMDRGESDIDGRTTRNREAQATGIGDYAGDPGTENAYRAERGEPPRTYY
jgi:uncharacterized Zn-binding protein involved in type VI secretion